MTKPFYISKEALERLQNELKAFKTTKRREVTDKIEAALALGDLSENAEYHDAKDELAMLEGRILEIEDQIKNAVIIDESKKATDMVDVGSEIDVETEGQKITYKIVGPNEADPAHGFISNETPLAQALLGHRQGESVEFNAPSGKKMYRIVSIK
ncbi:transcription elongation factor GreA [Patescibacteria group bacterium]|nr:transcription elongation factor GreA [Patescibacteria group bacterium]MBU1921618.1 transcription elongation factor GreA [Patescibacteria group bacterium]